MTTEESTTFIRILLLALVITLVLFIPVIIHNNRVIDECEANGGVMTGVRSGAICIDADAVIDADK